MFFLLSGYVIAISLDRYSRRGFLIGRTMRVLPTYAAGYLVTCATISLVSDPRHELSPGSVLAGAVPGLQYLVGRTAPEDGIVWTLVIELVFYAVCLVGYRTLTSRWWAIVGVAILCAVAQGALVPLPLGDPLRGLRFIVLLACPYIPVMLVGVVLSARRRGNLGPRSATALVPLLAGTYLLLASTSRLAHTTLTYRLTFVGTIALFAVVSTTGKGWKRHPATDFFASVSYPLYVVHPVIGYALLSIMFRSGVRALLAVIVVAGVAIACAWVIHTLVEVPTHRLGQRWARGIGYGSEPSAGHDSTRGPVLAR